MDIKVDINDLNNICMRYGLFKGVGIFLKVRLGFVEKIKLPDLKEPFSLRHRTSDIPTFYQVFIDDPLELDIKDPAVIIDGGANVGLFTLVMKNKYPGAKIICIEPDPDNFAVLKQNAGAYDDVFFENCGIWDKDIKLKVYDKYNLGKWGMIVEEDPINGTVPAISISSIIKKYALTHIDVLKLDIETSEKQVFADNFEEWLPKVKMLVIELHDKMEPGCSRPFFVAINKVFKNYKYYIKGEHTVIENLDFDY